MTSILQFNKLHLCKIEARIIRIGLGVYDRSTVFLLVLEGGVGEGIRTAPV